VPVEKVPNTSITYHLISYDDRGRERPDDPDGLMSGRAADAVRESGVTDVFLLCHGWRGDVPAARAQYTRWITAMAGCPADVDAMRRKRPGFRPLLVGLHWPSEPWGDDSLDGVASFATAGPDPVEELVAEAAARTADTPAARAALRTVVTAALEDNNPPRLPPPVRDAYAVLDRETGMAAGGEAAPPGDDREPFDAEAAYQEGQTSEVSFGGFADGVLTPVRVLSFWKMKDRARLVGESGAHQLLAALMGQAAGRGVRFHLMGHSFGCIVVSAAVAGPPGVALPAPIDSLALVQGALSLWSYCSDMPPARGRAGYFGRLAAEGRVRGPIVTTQSEFDRAVGTWYPWAAGLKRQVSFAAGERPRYGAVGAFGVHGPGAEGEGRTILPVDGDYGFRPGGIYNVESSGVINVGGGFSGAHSDIAKPQVGHAVWQAAMA
jgi:hypothetical protein